MARLWQTALLSEWKELFLYVPLESRIYEYQEEYYRAISVSHAAGNSDAFIEFMLKMIRLTLDQVMEQISGNDSFYSKEVRSLLNCMEPDVPYSALQLMEILGLKSKSNFSKHYLKPALSKELIEMGLPDKPTSRNQTYIKH